MSAANNTFGLVRCSCGAAYQLPYSAGTPSPARYKIACASCSATLEGSVELMPGPCADPTTQPTARLSSILTSAKVLGYTAQAMGAPGPWALDALEMRWEELSAPFLDPDHAHWSRADWERVRMLLVGLLFAVRVHPDRDRDPAAILMYRGRMEAVLAELQQRAEARE